MKFLPLLSILVMLLATFATAHADDTLGSKQDFMEDPGKIDYFTDPVTIEPIDYFIDPVTIEPIDYFANPATIPAREYPLSPDQRDYPLSNQDRSAIIHFLHSYLDNEGQESRLERICEVNPQLVEQIPQLAQYCSERTEFLDQLPKEEKLRIIHANIRAHLTNTYNTAVLNRACDTNHQLVEQIPQLVQYCNRRVELMDQLSNPSHTGELIPTLPVVAHDELIPSLPVTYDNKLTEL